MSNIGLIIEREYLSRVKKKTFIVMTILGPLLFGAFFLVIGWTATKGLDTKKIRVVDESGLFEDIFTDTPETTFEYMTNSLENGKLEVLEGQYDALLYIPKLDLDKPEGVTLYSTTNQSIALGHKLSNAIETEIENLKLKQSGIDKEVLDNLKSHVSIGTINLSESGAEKESSSVGATVVGYVASFLIYIFILVYGTQCMRGVVEEKTSRIIEVIISSVKPFQLMMGKVIGIAGVGLTQFILWIILTSAVSTLAGELVLNNLGGNNQTEQLQEMGVPQDEAKEALNEELDDNIYGKITAAVDAINLPMVVIAFLFFFLAGYLLYGALFAAIGSAVDSDADAQQFMFPVTMPLIAAIVMLSAVINDPNSTLSFWLSMIPLTSPVVMMMRVPFGVPWWELALSMTLMVGGFLFTIWVASRIYRIGILMHGTKVNYKVLAKWLVMKN